jgi:hypothetical protein
VTASRATDTVIANLDAQLPALNSRHDSRAACMSVLDHVRERFADDEIGRSLDGVREAPDGHLNAHRQRHPGHERVDPSSEPAVGERGGEDAVRQFSQL